VTEGKLEATNDSHGFKFVVPGSDIRLFLFDYPGDIQVRIRPWAHHRQLALLMRDFRDYYKVHLSPNSRVLEVTLFILGIAAFSLLLLMYVA